MSMLAAKGPQGGHSMQNLASKQLGSDDESGNVIDDGQASSTAPLSTASDEVLTATSEVPLFHYVLSKMLSNPRLAKQPVNLEARRQATADLADLFSNKSSSSKGKFDVTDIIPDMRQWRKVMGQVAEQHPHRQGFCRTLLDQGWATITIWTLPKGRILPMHSHPGRVVGRMLTGEIECMELSMKKRVLRAKSDTEGDVFTVDEGDNCHELKGLAEVSTFIEVTFPRYEDPEDCTYFQYNPAVERYMPACPPRFFRVGSPIEGPYYGQKVFPLEDPEIGVSEEEEEKEYVF